MGCKNNVEQCCGGRHCPVDKEKKLWSILICTLKERRKTFIQISSELMRQIKQNKLEGQVEVLYLCDSLYDVDKMTIGEKRNKLVDCANGKYVCFVDDDDMVSADYVSEIFQRLLKKPDCIGMVGTITFNGFRAKKFIHSIKYKEYFEDKQAYYRCPNHLNPILKSISQKIKYKNKSLGEDTDFAIELCKAGFLKKEEFIDYPIYFYRYKTKPQYVR